MQDYRGNYILAFAAYNAGRGRVREWIERFGDPRDPKVDPVDWVERIPFMETRNYVQRVMENIQVYRTLLGGNAPLTIETDLRHGVATNSFRGPLCRPRRPQGKAEPRHRWGGQGRPARLEERMPELAPPRSEDGEAHRWWPAGRQVQR